MVQSVEASLKRLKTNKIDLFFVHQDDFFTPMEEIVRGLDDLVRAGKIVYGGLSNFPAWRVSSASTMADLRSWSVVTAIEVEYSLLQPDTERDLLPLENNLKVSDVKLTGRQVKQLNKAGAIKLGHPHDFNSSAENRNALTGGKGNRIQKPHSVVG